MTEFRTKDVMRGRPRERIILRCDFDDVVELLCHHRYGNAGEGRVLLARKLEIKNPDDSWSSYPSVTWIDGVANKKQPVTRAVIRARDGQGRFDVVEGLQGVPDAILMLAAEKAGVYVEHIDG